MKLKVRLAEECNCASITETLLEGIWKTNGHIQQIRTAHSAQVIRCGLTQISRVPFMRESVRTSKRQLPKAVDRFPGSSPRQSLNTQSRNSKQTNTPSIPSRNQRSRQQRNESKLYAIAVILHGPARCGQ